MDETRHKRQDYCEREAHGARLSVGSLAGLLVFALPCLLFPDAVFSSSQELRDNPAGYDFASRQFGRRFGVTFFCSTIAATGHRKYATVWRRAV